MSTSSFAPPLGRRRETTALAILSMVTASSTMEAVVDGVVGQLGGGHSCWGRGWRR